jgi:hypothetical protein
MSPVLPKTPITEAKNAVICAAWRRPCFLNVDCKAASGVLSKKVWFALPPRPHSTRWPTLASASANVLHISSWIRGSLVLRVRNCGTACCETFLDERRTDAQGLIQCGLEGGRHRRVLRGAPPARCRVPARVRLRRHGDHCACRELGIGRQGRADLVLATYCGDPIDRKGLRGSRGQCGEASQGGQDNPGGASKKQR